MPVDAKNPNGKLKAQVATLKINPVVYRNCGFGAAKDKNTKKDVGVLLLSKKTGRNQLMEEIKKHFAATGATEARVGSGVIEASAEAANMLLITPASGNSSTSLRMALEVSLKAASIARSRVRFAEGDPAAKIRQAEAAMAADGPDADEDADAATDGTTANGAADVPPAQGPAADAGQLAQTLAALARRVAGVGDPAQKAVLAKLAGQANVYLKTNNPNYAASTIQQLSDALDAAQPQAAGGVSVAKLGKARLEWIGVRRGALAGLERLGATLATEFRNDVGQAPQLKGAIVSIRDRIQHLDATLEQQLDAVLNADGTKRETAVGVARATLRSLSAYIEADELLGLVDGNEVLPDMVVVAPMRDALGNIDAAMG